MNQWFVCFCFITNLLISLGSLSITLAFTSTSSKYFRKGFGGTQFTRDSSVFVSYSSSSDDINDGDIEGLRQMLEACWKTETMGNVPTNAESAAIAAAESIESAIESTGTRKSIFYVDIQLPQYDIMRGSRIYDEVLATEFCIALVNQLKGRFNIVVRDGKTLNTLSRIFSAREGCNVTAINNVPMQQVNDDDNKTVSITESDSFRGIQSSQIEYDDFADFDVIGDDEPSQSSTANVDVFRENLIQSWQSVPSSNDNKFDNKQSANNIAAPTYICYRLSSMFGHSKISRGPDMIDDVCGAVSINAQPIDDEDSIIVLSAVTQEEVIGIRALASKFSTKKNIILVNCQFPNNIVPKELIEGQTVYSILPLVARRKVSSASESSQKVPKVVVLRRYPRDWEVSVNVLLPRFSYNFV